MEAQEIEIQTVPQTVPDTVKPPRKVLKAGPVAVEVWNKMRQEAIEEADRRAKEQEAAEAVAAERALEQAAKVAERRGEEAERVGERGPLHVARDGLAWLAKKGKLHPAHERAGLKFREDFEVATSSGLVSALELEGGRSSGPKQGATDAQLQARDRVLRALASLGTDMLRPYVVKVAGEGEMLTAFVKDAKRADAHVLPCAIALDLLARHYGMIR